MARSRYEGWKRRAERLTLTLLLIISSCNGDTDHRDAGPTGPGGDAGLPDSDDTDATTPDTTTADTASDATTSCERFGLAFAPACGGCPASSAQYCPCLHETLGWNPFDGFESCGLNGRCLTAIDCEPLCAKAADAANTGLFEDLEALRSCVEKSKNVCALDGECRVGRCVGEATPAGGWCSTAEPGALCWEPSDCLAGRCLLAPPDATMPGGLPPGSGLCSTGMRAEPCFADGDCAASRYCFRPGNGAGGCFGGALGEPCRTSSDCQTNRCSSNGKCIVGGTVGDTCGDDRDCANGTCVTDAVSTSKVCVTGEPGTLCFTAAQCPSAICALTTLNGRPAPGFCENGDAGDPCTDARDCKSQNCVSNQTPQPNLCPTTRANRAVPCGEGICSTIAGLCVYGKCAP